MVAPGAGGTSCPDRFFEYRNRSGHEAPPSPPLSPVRRVGQPSPFTVRRLLSFVRRLPAAVLCLLFSVLCAPATARAHGLTFTRVEAEFARPGFVDITVEYDLGLVLPADDSYHALTLASPEKQRATVTALLPQILEALQFYAGNEQLRLELQGFTLPTLPAEAFTDPAQDKSTVLRFTAALPAQPAPLVLVVPYAAPVNHPVAFAVRTPQAGVLARFWVEEGPSEPFDWTSLVPAAPMPWWREFGGYLRLGCKHIVPDGLDHILFVLALFFLGLEWRKLIAQTTVFTVAHATTLFLSHYGVVHVSSRLVEPLIAFSIACIALENIFRPKLGPARLALVFGFGLVHGLGFAASLSEVKFPRDRFLTALLGFNLGVDFGQLLIIALAFLVVGWFRHKPWFRTRVVVPCCAAIAATGLCWTVQRIFL
ncbi:MAG TPA: HupE/UreJ family protein [Lacunisphaera sp.]|nr:HupE/UreJ family protein [Lacunisphaera sp.]